MRDFRSLVEAIIMNAFVVALEALVVVVYGLIIAVSISQKSLPFFLLLVSGFLDCVSVVDVSLLDGVGIGDGIDWIGAENIDSSSSGTFSTLATGGSIGTSGGVLPAYSHCRPQGATVDSAGGR